MADNVTPAAAPVSSSPAAPASQAAEKAPVTTAPSATATPQDPKAAAPQSHEAKQAELAKKYKVKIDGQEAEVDESELVRGYQRAQAAQKRFEAAAAKERQLEELYNSVQGDPGEFIKKAFNVDVDTWAEQRLAAKIRQLTEAETLSPEAKRVRELEAEKQQWMTEKQREEQARQQAQMQAEIERHAQEYRIQAAEALKRAGLPETDAHMLRLRTYAAQSLDKYGEIYWDDIADQVRDDIKTEHTHFFANLEGDALLEALGEPVWRKVNAALLAKSRAKQGQLPVVATKRKVEASPAEKKTPLQTRREAEEFLQKNLSRVFNR